jgi:DNA repair exonuclease SbcCD nuclease subunit
MKILHTSDVQLDAPFRFLGAAGGKHRAQLRRTFSAIVDLAATGAYAVLVIAGDLFDSNAPQQRTVDDVLSSLGGLSIPVCILPGNHDHYGPTSIYRKVAFPSNVTIFTDQMTKIVFPELDLAVHGNAVSGGEGKGRPMEGLEPCREVRWNVALVHGNLLIGDEDETPRPIRPEDIAASGMNYVALGDWHGYGEHTRGAVTAAYSGSPEPTAFNQENAGYVASVHLDENGTHLEPLKIGAVEVLQAEIPMMGRSKQDLIERLKALVAPNRMLEVRLTGVAEVGLVIDVDQLEELIRPDLYAIRIRDETHPSVTQWSASIDSEDPLLSHYLEHMRSRIEGAEDAATRRQLERALQLGAALLQGKEVL